MSRHGEPPWVRRGAAGVGRGGRGYGWWKKISEMAEWKDGKWFWENVERRLGEGRETDFWEGDWAGVGMMKTRFPCLFHLSAKQNASVSDMGDGKWRWKVQW